MYYEMGTYYETFWSVLCLSSIFLHNSSYFIEMWEESQIGIIHFLLLISHNLVAIAKRFPLPYLLPIDLRGSCL